MSKAVFQSPDTFLYYAATEADVPGKSGASIFLQAIFNSLNAGTLVVVATPPALYFRPNRTSYADGGRIAPISSGGGTGSVGGTYSNAADAVEVNSAVFLVADGTVALADASDGTASPAFGFVTAIITSTTCTVSTYGEVIFPSLTPGARYYLSTAGTITTTPSSVLPIVQYLGRAKSDGVTLDAFADPSGGVGLILNDNSQNASDSTFAELALIHTCNGVVASAGIGASLVFKAQTGGGHDTAAGRVRGGFLDVTSGAQIGAIELRPAYGGALATAGIRVSAPVASVVNGLDVIPAVDGGYVQVIPYGDTTDVSLVVGGKGIGSTTIAVGATPVVNVGTAGMSVTVASTVVSNVTSAGLDILVSDATSDAYTTVATFAHRSTSASAAGIGARVLLKARNDAGANAIAGMIGGQLGTVAAASSQGLVEIVPAFAGAVAAAGLRVSGSVASVVNGLNIIPTTAAAATTTGVQLAAYGSSTDVSLHLVPLGSGAILFDPGTGTGGIKIGLTSTARVGLHGATPIIQASAAVVGDTLPHLVAWLVQRGDLGP